MLRVRMKMRQCYSFSIDGEYVCVCWMEAALHGEARKGFFVQKEDVHVCVCVCVCVCAGGLGRWYLQVAVSGSAQHKMILARRGVGGSSLSPSAWAMGSTTSRYKF